MAAMHEQRFRFEPVAHEAAITAAFDREGAHVVSSRKFGRADWRSVTRQSRKAEYAALFRPARADPGQPADRHRRAGRGGGGDQGTGRTTGVAGSAEATRPDRSIVSRLIRSRCALAHPRQRQLYRSEEHTSELQ